MWVRERSGDKPIRPWVAGWVSLTTRFGNLSEPSTDAQGQREAVLNTLVDMACNEELAGYRPAKVQVAEPPLAMYLREMLHEVNIEVELQDVLPMLEQMLSDMGEEISEQPLPPQALATEGVTVEMMRAFAEAAAQFYRAQPWEQLSSDDLLKIESPPVEAGLRHATVLGAAAGTFGLGFYKSRAEFERLLENPSPQWLTTGKHWALLFGPITDLPFGDVNLWERYDLPLAGEDAYPLAVCYDPKGRDRRPGPDVLAFLEGLLRALALTTEPQMDAGRWQMEVETFEGPMAFTFSLPGLLEPPPVDRNAPLFSPLIMDRIMASIEREMEGKHFETADEMAAYVHENFIGKRVEEFVPETPLERAQDLVYQAHGARGRRQIHLAHQALEIDPNCADAYLVLAERTWRPDKQLEHYTQAVQAAERALDPEVFEKQAGHFWDIIATRPYMRARFGLAECLERLHRLEEAAGYYRELLCLDPEDNQGVRFSLWPCLLRLGKDSEVKVLLKQNKDDEGECVWDYTRALLTFREQGDTAAAQEHLRQALEHNETAAEYLMEGNPFPKPSSDGRQLLYDEEAAACLELLSNAWRETAGALEWLDEAIGWSEEPEEFEEEPEQEFEP